MATTLKRALEDSGLVQSFSGVRTSFGIGPGILDHHKLLATTYGRVYATNYLKGLSEAILLLGRDPRPTGEAVATSLARGIVAGALSVNCEAKVLDLGVITTPLLQTAVRALSAAGGAMITASHNPLTDNGFKFLTGCRMGECGTPDSAPAGALLSAYHMASVVHQVQRIGAGDGYAADLDNALRSLDDETFSGRFIMCEDSHQRVTAERAYLDELADEWGIQPHCLKPLVLGPALVDPNGGSACGISARVLEHFGVRTIEINAELGYPEHSIDTDGIDPASGKHMLLRIARAALREGARFGVAFDYDADRGNLVLPGLDESAIIYPQTVAAANIAIALAHREVTRREDGRLAVVVSDATSGASRKVAALFGAEIFTVETGEVNVVTKMHQLRCEGYDVPVGVEGANGGTIFGRSTCRDGLQAALCAALADENPILARQWVEVLTRNGKPVEARRGLRLPEILAGMPQYHNRMFRLEGPAMPHGEIKSAMEENFTRLIWPEIKHKYQSFSFEDYEGTGAVRKRTGDESGGWRLVLTADEDQDTIFARGSRTEAGVWRLIVDSPDSTQGESLEQIGMTLFDAAAKPKTQPCH